MTALMPEKVISELDNDVLAHIINCPSNKESSEAWITEARIYGLEVTALCGHKFIPERNPENKKVCDPCLDLAERILT